MEILMHDPKQYRRQTNVEIFKIFFSLILLVMMFYPATGALQAKTSENNPGISLTNNGQVFNVKDYGAKGDGHTLDSPAINKAIDAAASAGGGTVFFPAGTYLSGSIHLKSNITLYISSGATIKATSDASDYDAPEPNKWKAYQDFGHSHFHNSLIWGTGLQNISIIGHGLIYGAGLSRDLNKRDHLPADLYGNKSIALKNCHNVILRDFSILKGGHFGILATGVDNLTIDNLIIDTNRDGMDIDACRNVRVSNCTVNSPWDDAIVLKSSYALGYEKDTQDVTISDCMVSGDYQMGSVIDGTFEKFPPGSHVSHTGRIKCGTESDGGFKNITISNCVFDHCQGLALESVDGGHMVGVSVSNITMRDIVNMPIFLRLGSRMRGPKGRKIGVMRDINISNIVVYNSSSRAASTISGIPGHNIKNVRISNVQFVIQGGGKKDWSQIQVPEKADAYPEPTMFGTLPSYGFFIRHADGIELDNIKIKTKQDDYRPAFYLDDVDGIKFDNVNIPHVESIPTFNLNNVKDFQSEDVKGLKDHNIQSMTKGSL